MIESVEQLEAIFEALKDFNSIPERYRIRSFGYCLSEDRVTQYEYEGGPEGVNIHCLGCGRNFGTLLMGSEPFHFYQESRNVPAKCRAEVDKLHSRENQTRFFLEELGAFLAEKKQTSETAEKLFKETRATVDKLSAMSIVAQAIFTPIPKVR